MKNNKKQLHEALAVLLTKLSSARDNPLLIDNYVVKELNPQFAKDKARDERIAGIENEVAGMKGDIAKILAAVTKQ